MLCFLKNTPTASKNLSRGRETFLVELPVFEMVSNYAPLSWCPYASLSIHCFCGQTEMAERGCYLGCPGIVQMGKLRLREAREECHTLCWSPSLRQTQISGFQTPFLSPLSEVTSRQPVATSTPQMYFCWPEGVLIWMSCQHLKIRRFHIKTQISGFSWSSGRSAK